MAEGGNYYKYKPLENDGSNEEEEEDEEEEVNRTHPFDPQVRHPLLAVVRKYKCKLCSTRSPACQTLLLMQKPLLVVVLIEHKSRLEKAYDFIQKKFPNVSFEALGPLFIGRTKGNEDSVVWLDKDSKEKRVFKKRGTDFKKIFPKNFPKNFKKVF